ncbi:MAG: hypothetical protein CM15mV34_2210 [Caudoviricetes sp.]|nr:MAG: hypothetical protein CM15mV34_2210 [Caudoviricetes sp.]
MNPHALYHVKEWDKKMAKKIQDKFGLTDYQMLCIAFAKGRYYWSNFTVIERPTT